MIHLPTRLLEVNTSENELGHFEDRETFDNWIPPSQASNLNLYKAAEHLRSRHSHVTPVAFPTETVYGLGADATNSDAVKGIYKAKGRPSDNPLIIHVCDLNMLRETIHPGYLEKVRQGLSLSDPIPATYQKLIRRFWPGPLTIILPNPEDSKLAPEVTAGLSTFGARMPDSPLALSLIRLTGHPLAAPSANASTRPSPTTAYHVLQDLDGKIDLIVNGGAGSCTVGLESTVVDGLCHPPVILRPGGVSIDSIREVTGWEDVQNAYQDSKEVTYGLNAPRAPGMKYKHYSPKAKVVLYESITPCTDNATISTTICNIKNNERKNIDNLSNHPPSNHAPWRLLGDNSNACEIPELPVKIGIISTRHWEPWGGLNDSIIASNRDYVNIGRIRNIQNLKMISSTAKLQKSELWLISTHNPNSSFNHDKYLEAKNDWKCADVFEIPLGIDTRQIAHDLFMALREMDEQEVEVILIEGINDKDDLAAAVMNRLRKAAAEIK
ncbi:Threonylcarbamoyl-AMP synthase [Erysiphe neolycopersici]|uniref:Threonylcarbamoyl-AMP synthase n=1 Tax=Erysiphe neolycopersici TaxID=212602 RepID=A0A420HVW3_9PEZI|nr:Threonylcarbamoyl-AMP synthase [Erysiphe neolycopersici]